MTRQAWILIGVLVVLGGVTALSVFRLEGTPPVLSAPDEVTLGEAGQLVSVSLSDEQSGLREFSARLLHGAGSQSVAHESYRGGWLGGGAPGGERKSVEILLDVAELLVPDGTATLVLSARDWSWRDGFSGNRSELSIPVLIDTRPPSISLVSGLTYVYRGGSAAAVYSVSEDTPRHGVRVGDVFFPGFPHPAGGERTYVALFAVPVDAARNPAVEVVAVDAAGNGGETRFPAHVLERAFSKSEIVLENDFLERVVLPLAREAGLEAPDPIAAFQRVNHELRPSNEETIRQLLVDSSPERYWQGAFSQLRGSKVMSRFAEHRTYLVRGQNISEARHFGFDLASTARSVVTAAASGVVVSTGELGIYGRYVLVDHGLGVASLYGHLSQIDVAAGDRLAQEDRIGLSGATGLAAGDHLHFAILVGGSYVDPLEWWDPKWVRSHVEVRLERSTR